MTYCCYSILAELSRVLHREFYLIVTMTALDTFRLELQLSEN